MTQGTPQNRVGSLYIIYTHSTDTNVSDICVQNIVNFLFYIYYSGTRTEWAKVLRHLPVNKTNNCGKYG